MNFNIYFGTIGKTLGVKYRYSKKYRNRESALADAKKSAESFYYKNEGTYGLPSFKEISNESRITGLNLDTLYKDHINDMMRYFVIPTEEDTISSSDLKW